jgi:hypothetical protein
MKSVTRSRARVQERQQVASIHRAHENYKKAQKRAHKKGRELPPRDEYYHNYWGYPYMMYGPWVYPAYYTPGLYYGSDPASAPSGTGAEGACAKGTCGGGVAAGACAGTNAGGCGSACGGGSVCQILPFHLGHLVMDLSLIFTAVRCCWWWLWRRGRW